MDAVKEIAINSIDTDSSSRLPLPVGCGSPSEGFIREYQRIAKLVPLVGPTEEYAAKMALIGALQSGNESVAYEALERGAKLTTGKLIFIGWGGNLNFMKLFDERSPRYWHPASLGIEIDWNLGLNGAAHGGHIPVMEYMIERGATNLPDAFLAACFVGQAEAAGWLAERAKVDYLEGLCQACRGRSYDMVTAILDDDPTLFDKAAATPGLYEAIGKGGRIDILEIFPWREGMNPRIVMRAAIRKDHAPIFNYVLEGANPGREFVEELVGQYDDSPKCRAVIREWFPDL